MRNENAFVHTLKSIWLCMKYPFLYPRNRWNGKHYNNWAFDGFIHGDTLHPSGETGIYQKAFSYEFNYDTYEGKRTVINYWYAFLYYICQFIYDYPMQWIHCIPTYTEWDAMDGMPGWKKAFGDQYLKELKAQLKKDKILYRWRITDLKEKYGTLRLYCNLGSDDLYKIIDKYEDLSYETCIQCGEPAKIITEGYVLPYCEHCWSSMEYPHKIGLYKIDGVHWVDADEITVSDKKIGDK